MEQHVPVPGQQQSGLADTDAGPPIPTSDRKSKVPGTNVQSFAGPVRHKPVSDYSGQIASRERVRRWNRLATRDTLISRADSRDGAIAQNPSHPDPDSNNRSLDSPIHLALETSTRSGSFSLLEGPTSLSTVVLPRDRTTTSSLTSELERILDESGLQPADLKLVSVSIGPGSFTGLRVAVTVARTLAWVNGSPIAAVRTHEIVARQVFETLQPEQRDFSSRVASLIPAQRGEWFAEIHEVNELASEVLEPGRIVSPAEFVRALNEPVWLGGPGLGGFIDQLPELPDQVRVSPESAWQPAASTCGRIGYAQWRAGKLSDIWQLLPEYGRKSAAEEKLDARTSADSGDDR